MAPLAPAGWLSLFTTVTCGFVLRTEQGSEPQGEQLQSAESKFPSQSSSRGERARRVPNPSALVCRNHSTVRPRPRGQGIVDKMEI